MPNKGFQKYINVAPSGAKKKEKLKQEKRAVKKERAAYFDGVRAEKAKAYKEAQEQRYMLDKQTQIPQKKQIITKPTRNKTTVSKTITATTVTKAPTTPTLERNRPKPEKSTAGRKSFFKTKDALLEEKRALHTPKTAPVPVATIAKKPKTIQAKYTQPTNKPVLIANTKVSSEMPLNKYIAHCGICSRRDAAEVVKQGKIKVNNKVITEPGYKLLSTDVVKLDGKEIKTQHNLVYILLNKPKDFLTTASDPQGRKTVMDLVASATAERVYPVGRLDRNTTGVLLITNDGDLAQKLTHPKHEIKKIYEVKLDRALTKADAETILEGVELEDGMIAPDALAFVDNMDKSIVGIEIHSGKNRIVRRIFEKMGYDVKNLDRVMFANLTKKNVERGRYRFLNEKEVRNLKFLNAAKGVSKQIPMP